MRLAAAEQSSPTQVASDSGSNRDLRSEGALRYFRLLVFGGFDGLVVEVDKSLG